MGPAQQKRDLRSVAEDVGFGDHVDRPPRPAWNSRPRRPGGTQAVATRDPLEVAALATPEAAARAAAEAAGLEVASTEVVTVQNNVLVRIEPGPVAARVSNVLIDLRDVRAALGKEVRICRELAQAAAPVPSPLGPAEPFVHQGRTVTLWKWLAGTTGAGEPAPTARALRSCHEALMSTSEPLDPWDRLREARESFTPRAPSAVREELECLGAAAHDCVIEIRDGLRPVHGDAYPGNFMWTVQGPILIDWEDAHLAPVEWDLASLVYYARTFGGDLGWADAALGAYGRDWDHDRLERCLTARGFQGAAYMAALSAERPELGAGLDARLAWLRERLA